MNNQLLLVQILSSLCVDNYKYLCRIHLLIPYLYTKNMSPHFTNELKKIVYVGHF